METLLRNIQEFVNSIIPPDFNLNHFLTAALVICVGGLVIAGLGRLIFGKKSVLNQSVSSLIGILFIYAVTIVVYSYGVGLDFLISPLPFVTLGEEHLYLFPILSADYTQVCGHLLDMVILAFLVNLVNHWLPTGKKLLSWLLYRCLSVVIAMVLYTIVNSLLTAYLPEGLLTWAPVILLAILLGSLLLGALKLVVGAVLTTINPLIAVLYTFFFASVLGKHVSKALLTTALAALLVAGLDYLGISAIYIGAAALSAYIPLVLILLVLWFVIGKLL